MRPSKELVKAIRRAVGRIDKCGLDGDVPEQEIKEELGSDAGVEEGLRAAVSSCSPERLAATIRLARVTGTGGLANEIASLALRRPVPLNAKEEAVGLLRDVGVEIPQEVEDTLRIARQFVESPDAKSLETVLALPEAWKEPVLAAWLARPCSDAGLLESVLGLDPRMDTAIVERLGASGAQGAVPVLQRLVGGEDRKLRKAAKRALHRLRSTGVDVAGGRPTQEAFSLEIAPDVHRDSRAFVTGIDGSGGRILWVMAPSSKGGYRLLEAVIDDQQGLRKSEMMSVALKGFRSHIERLRANPALLIAQLELPQAVAILRTGEALAAAAGTALPPEYEVWRDELAAELFSTAAEIQQEESDTVDSAGEMASAAKILERLGRHSRAAYGFVLDTGHANIDGDLKDIQDHIGDHLISLHLNDNDGKGDSHLAPGEGNVDWATVARILKDGEFQGVVMYEIEPGESSAEERMQATLRGYKEHLESV